MKTRTVLLIFAFILFTAHTVRAGSVTIPNVFTPETPARADSVNENFSALDIAVDDNAAMITSLQSAYGATRTGYVSLSPLDFQPMQDGYDYYINSNGLSAYAPVDSYFNAGLHLPQGAVITSFTVWYYDTSATKDLRFSISRNTGTGVAFGIGPYIFSSGSSGYGSATSGSDSYNVVDNLNYSYGATVRAHAAVSFKRAVITYEYTID